MKIWRDLLILVAVFGAIWWGFTYQPVDLPDTEINLSEERETELSELILKDLRKKYDFYEDTVVADFINPITSRLLDSLKRPKYDYTFHLVKSEQINAFATLDGHIFVFSGLLSFVDNPEQLAGILAHEIGHHENGDLVDRLIKELSLSVILAIMTGGDAVMISEMSKLLISSGFDRKQEREADEFAHDLMIKTGIKPARLAHFFMKLKADEKTYPDELEIIMTHPNSKHRIEDALEAELPEEFVEVPFPETWTEEVASFFK